MLGELLLLMVAAWIGGTLVARRGYPAVLGEIMAGILLGPPLLGWLTAGVEAHALAEVGVAVMMLYVGMEIDPDELRKASLGALASTLGGFLLPAALTAWFVLMWGGSSTAAAMVGLAAGVTSLATKSRILADLQILDTRIAHVMMAGALITDTLVLVLFAGIEGFADLGRPDFLGILGVVVRSVLFFAVIGYVGIRVFPRLAGWLVARGFATRTGLFTIVLLIALGFGELAELAGLHAVLGSFFAGLFLREGMFGPRISKELMEVVRDASVGFLAPIFFVISGFEVDLGVFVEAPFLLFGVVGLAIVGKVIGTAVAYALAGYPWREGIAIAAGMNDRGAVEIILAGIALEGGLIDRTVYSVLVFMAIFTTATVPVTLSLARRWLERRGELVRARANEDIVVLGAGPLARRVARMLTGGRTLSVVDLSSHRCAEALAQGLEAVWGDAGDAEVLARAGVARAGTVIGLIPNPTANGAALATARAVFDAPLLLASVRPDDVRAITSLGADTAFAVPIDLEDWDLAVEEGRVEQVEIEVTRALRGADLATPDTLLVGVRREGLVQPVGALTPLVKGDVVAALRRTAT